MLKNNLLKNSYFFAVILLFISINTYSQITPEDNKNPTEDFTLDNKRYRPLSNYLIVGIGAANNFDLQQLELSGDISYNFKIKKHWFQLGYHNSNENFFLYHSDQKLIDLRAGYGKRWEKLDRNQAIFAGVSYSYGSTFAYDSLDATIHKIYYRSFTEPGVFFDYQMTYKFAYDLGIGFSVFGSFNKYYQVAGLRLHVYFSGAYRGMVDDK